MAGSGRCSFTDLPSGDPNMQRYGNCSACRVPGSLLQVAPGVRAAGSGGGIRLHDLDYCSANGIRVHLPTILLAGGGGSF